MHRTMKVDGPGNKDKDNNGIKLAYYPNFTGFAQKTTFQEATLNSIWRGEGHIYPRGRKHQDRRTVLARGMGREKYPERQHLTVRDPVGQGIRMEEKVCAGFQTLLYITGLVGLEGWKSFITVQVATRHHVLLTQARSPFRKRRH